MIIDSNLVLFEGAVATKQGEPIALNALQIPGKAEPIPLAVRFTESLAGATAVKIKLQQSDSATSAFSDVAGAVIDVPAADFKVGKRVAWRFLPRTLTKTWLRLDITVTGNATAGKLFAAIMREEDESYEAGQYISKGEVVG